MARQLCRRHSTSDSLLSLLPYHVKTASYAIPKSRSYPPLVPESGRFAFQSDALPHLGKPDDGLTSTGWIYL
jgi:hypothetical protein